MRKTQLILIEGLSGSGKSTMAHYLSRQLTLHDIEHTWWYIEENIKYICTVKREQGYLFLNGISYIWPHNRLIVLSRLVFAVDSFPFKVRFIEDTNGTIYQMHLIGPEQLFHTVDCLLTR